MNNKQFKCLISKGGHVQMDAMPNVNELIKILGDSTRIKILDLLMDGRFYTVNEIARYSKIANSTASYHLKKMNEIGWLTAYRRGRFSYYALIDENIAEVLEKLMIIAPPKKVQSYNQKQEIIAVKKARTCYHHLAGSLGVNLLSYFEENNYLFIENQQVSVTEKGQNFFFQTGIDTLAIQKQSGEFAKLCLDWSERQFHLAGNLGKALYRNLLENDWLTHSETDRSVRLTASAPEWLQKLESQQ